MKVVIIGSGNVATVYAQLLFSHKHIITQVYSQQFTHAQSLATTVNAIAIDNLQSISNEVDLIIIAVADRAIASIVYQMPQVNCLVLHTAASVSIDVLSKVSNNYGVLYPIQTIRKEMSLQTPIPFAINGNNDVVIQQLQTLVHSIQSTSVIYSDEQRLKLHVAAIFACNFVNYMYLQSAAICKNEHIDFSDLQPLIEETANRLKYHHPKEVFTGPAVRGDENTIQKHIKLLQSYPQLQELYQMLSFQIMKEFKQ